MQFGFYQGFEEINLVPFQESPIWKVLNANGTVINIYNEDLRAHDAYVNFTLVLER